MYGLATQEKLSQFLIGPVRATVLRPNTRYLELSDESATIAPYTGLEVLSPPSLLLITSIQEHHCFCRVYFSIRINHDRLYFEFAL